MLVQSAQTMSRFFHVLTETRHHASALFSAERKNGHIDPQFLEDTMRIWAERILRTVRVEWKVLGDDGTLATPAIVVGNHVSYLDIPMLMTQMPVSFVAKKQIGDWPVFGHACRSVGTVFVERDCGDSRRNTAEAIGPFVLEKKRCVAIFPSGTTTVDESKPWRWGAFLIAKRYGIPIRPFRLRYEPLRRAAFINEDLFPTHLWNLMYSGGVRATIEFHPLVQVSDPQADAMRWWEWTREVSTSQS